MNNKQIQKEYSLLTSYRAPNTTNSQGLRLHLNENLFGPSPKCIAAVKELSSEDLCFYDLDKEDNLVTVLAKKLNLIPDNIVLQAGSSEMLKTILGILLHYPGQRVLLPNPSWSYYRSIADFNFAEVQYFDLDIDETNSSYIYSCEKINRVAVEFCPHIIILTSPNMPTGNLLYQSQLENIAESNPNTVIIVDEAYWGYSNNNNINISEVIEKFPSIIFVRTFSKFFGLANERVGFCYCGKFWKDIIETVSPLFRLSASSRAASIAALEDMEYYDNIRQQVIDVREKFISQLNAIEGVRAYKSEANFVFIKFNANYSKRLAEHLIECGYIVRLFTSKHNSTCNMRITLSNERVMHEIIQEIYKFIQK